MNFNFDDLAVPYTMKRILTITHREAEGISGQLKTVHRGRAFDENDQRKRSVDRPADRIVSRRTSRRKKQNEAGRLKNYSPRAFILPHHVRNQSVNHRCGNCEKITKCPPGSFTTISFAPYELS
jgi:nitrate reductase cytochrome c-type subunit